jgi:hypothetical protein
MMQNGWDFDGYPKSLHNSRFLGRDLSPIQIFAKKKMHPSGLGAVRTYLTHPIIVAVIVVNKFEFWRHAENPAKSFRDQFAIWKFTRGGPYPKKTLIFPTRED